MLEWMLGLLVVAVVIAKILEVFELIDLFELVGGALKLAAGLLFAVGGLFIWLMARRSSEKKPGQAWNLHA